MHTSENRAIKTLSIAAFIFISLALVLIAKTPPANSYEISIYNAYPIHFWIFIILSIFIGQMILIKSSLNLDRINKVWIFGFLAILMTNTILLILPFIRGYTIYGRGDVLTHIGSIKDIMSSASIGISNYYPIVHILAASISDITNLDVEYSIYIIPVIFSLCYIISIYLLANKLFGINQALFVFAFSSILVLSNAHFIFAPSALSFAFTPTLLYLFFKSRGLQTHIGFRILLIVSVFFIVFSHPITTLFMIIIFIVFEICVCIYHNNKSHTIHQLKFKHKNSINTILILLVSFCAWYFTYSSIINNFRKILNWFIEEVGTTEANQHFATIAQTHPKILDIIQLILNTYGQSIILGIISLLMFINIVKFWRCRPDFELGFNRFFFSIISIFFCILSIYFFFNDFIIGSGRVLKYFLFVSPVIGGLYFHLLFSKSKPSTNSKTIRIILMGIVLMLLISFSTLNLYMSPMIKKTNQQVSEAEITGMNWFFEHRNENLPTLEFHTSQKRFYDLTYGVLSPRKNIRYGLETQLSDHFGYLDETLIGHYYNDRSYLVMQIVARKYYPELYPTYETQWRFSSEDFQMFENDTTVVKIFGDGDLDTYLID